VVIIECVQTVGAGALSEPTQQPQVHMQLS